MVVVSVTRLRVRVWYYLPAFYVRAILSARQAKNSEGVLAVKVFGDRRNTFWTLTLWKSEVAMRAFMLAKPHGPTMRKLLEWCDEASLVHWTQDSADVPTWGEAHRRLLKEGRRSKVNHPSQTHIEHAIPAPTESLKGEVRFK
jgi:hypothetical protein